MKVRTDLPYLEWMDAEGWETLNTCFDWEIGEIPPGASRETGGRAAWLLSGEGVFRIAADADVAEAGAEKPVSPGMFFGVKRVGTSGKAPEEGRFTALTACTAAWFDYDLLVFACYRGCGFHARVMREAEEALDRMTADR